MFRKLRRALYLAAVHKGVLTSLNKDASEILQRCWSMVTFQLVIVDFLLSLIQSHHKLVWITVNYFPLLALSKQVLFSKGRRAAVLLKAVASINNEGILMIITSKYICTLLRQVKIINQKMNRVLKTRTQFNFSSEHVSVHFPFTPCDQTVYM